MRVRRRGGGDFIRIRAGLGEERVGLFISTAFKEEM
jgi:hypothetical protein